MNKSIKRVWVSALKSGEYEQHKLSTLKSDEGFDPLGVLCEIHRKTAKKKGWYKANKHDTSYSYMSCSNTLPVQVAKWAGIAGKDDDNLLVPVLHQGKASAVAFLADDGMSFKQIASIIDRSL